jgi:hypothetical protein
VPTLQPGGRRGRTKPLQIPVLDGSVLTPSRHLVESRITVTDCVEKKSAMNPHQVVLGTLLVAVILLQTSSASNIQYLSTGIECGFDGLHTCGDGHYCAKAAHSASSSNVGICTKRVVASTSPATTAHVSTTTVPVTTARPSTTTSAHAQTTAGHTTTTCPRLDEGMRCRTYGSCTCAAGTYCVASAVGSYSGVCQRSVILY